MEKYDVEIGKFYHFWDDGKSSIVAIICANARNYNNRRSQKNYCLKVTIGVKKIMFQ